eukprot:gnl/MRDRNA2_/MRDRNA2_43522_c0_seq1.p1 gnl/MRDRNA2_/MRDRNA2_43522_c0~~gnl/MRDRNA2_/MRDRNA2_43522_c0_seq1.p1  ORF type:complete len:234 (+),score=20.47 gnl/MRDRNA2_/MRDRNA2_43522_c0_seq1:71-772(+)
MTKRIEHLTKRIESPRPRREAPLALSQHFSPRAVDSDTDDLGDDPKMQTVPPHLLQNLDELKARAGLNHTGDLRDAPEVPSNSFLLLLSHGIQGLGTSLRNLYMCGDGFCHSLPAQTEDMPWLIIEAPEEPKPSRISRSDDHPVPSCFSASQEEDEGSSLPPQRCPPVCLSLPVCPSDSPCPSSARNIPPSSLSSVPPSSVISAPSGKEETQPEALTPTKRFGSTGRIGQRFS